MKLRLSALAFVLAVSALGALPADAGKKTEVRTTLDISYQRPGGVYSEGLFSGEVGSKRRYCFFRREVKVISKRDGVVGTDEASRSGEYAVPAARGIKGKVFAKAGKRVRESRKGRKLVCKRVRSRAIRLR